MSMPTSPPPAGPPPFSPPPQSPSRSRAVLKSRPLRSLLGLVVVAVLTGAAFFGGRLSVDPTTSKEFRAQAKELQTNRSQVVSLGSQLSDAQAQVDALVADVPEDEGGGPTDPAMSGGHALAPRNIKIGLKVRSKECFGSAGCNLEVQIDPNYVGDQDLSNGSWDITYEIRGGEDGPVVETMTLEDGTFSFPESQSVSTSSTSTQLTAVATSVDSSDG